MLSEKALLLIATETPLHAGGGSSLGAIDLPIQRERHTDYPMIQASGVKGALRDLAYSAKRVGVPQRKAFDAAARDEARRLLETARDEERVLPHLGDPAETILALEAAFGPETDRADAHAGALAFTDARLLLFPVRSLQGVFAWVTSPFALARFKGDLQRIGRAVPWAVPSVGEEDALTGTTSTLRAGPGNEVVLEEYAFNTPASAASAAVDEIAEYLVVQLGLFAPSDSRPAYWRDRLWSSDRKTNLVILSDTAFRDFALHSTEVISRIRINPATGTVASGALWSEEHLPSDTVMYSLVLADEPRSAKTHTVASAADVLRLLRDVIEEEHVSVIQLGGDETVGRGFVTLSLCHGSSTKEGSA